VTQPPYPQPYPQPPPQPYPQPQAARRRSPLPWLIALVGVLALLCCGGATGVVLYYADREAAPPLARPGPRADAPEERPRADAPTASPTASPTAGPATTPPATRDLPEDTVYEGRGDKVIRLSLPGDLRHTATFTHRGDSNFAVWALDAGGQRRDLVVNEVGRYSGVRPLDFERAPSALEIEADGAWTVTVRVFDRIAPFGGSASGGNPTVLRLETVATPVRATVTHGGRSNFVVVAYGERRQDLLVNEIGRYAGEVLLPAGTVAVAIEADGPWTLRRS
jgi:hypothetical protein